MPAIEKAALLLLRELGMICHANINYHEWSYFPSYLYLMKCSNLINSDIVRFITDSNHIQNKLQMPLLIPDE